MQEFFESTSKNRLFLVGAVLLTYAIPYNYCCLHGNRLSHREAYLMFQGAL